MLKRYVLSGPLPRPTAGVRLLTDKFGMSYSKGTEGTVPHAGTLGGCGKRADQASEADRYQVIGAGLATTAAQGLPAHAVSSNPAAGALPLSGSFIKARPSALSLASWDGCLYMYL